MRSVEILIGLFVAVVVLVRMARRLELPPPIALVVGGVALSFVPGLARIELDQELVFALFLPPLLYYAAWATSWRDFRRNARPIGLLAVGLVLMTTAAVGVVAHEVVEGLPWAAAFVLGAIVSPTDAIAATSITGRIGVPRRIITVLEGESLVNDATGIVAYRLAVAAVVTGAFSVWEAGAQFLLVSAGGVAVGVGAGWLFIFLLRRFDDPPVENTIGLIIPFAAYLVAESLHVSGVLAVVAAGLYAARGAARVLSSETRLQAYSFWQMLDFLFNGLLFLLVGLQLRGIIEGLAGRSVWECVVYASVVSLTVILARFVWVIPATYLPRMLSKSLRERDPSPPWQSVAVIGWTGMRGAISLAAALALPYTTDAGAPFPERDLIIFLAFSVIIATLVAQGLSLSRLIRLLGLRDDGASAREEAEARLEVTRAGLKRIDELAKADGVSKRLIARLQADYKHRQASVEAALMGGEAGCVEFFAADKRLRAEVLKAEREALIGLRERDAIHDGVMHQIERGIDLEEQQHEAVDNGTGKSEQGNH